ncbi:MAG: peptide deformylase [Candidatus Absconditabacterales bacterium]
MIDNNCIIQTGLNNPILRTISLPVKEIDKEVKKFCNDLKKNMRENDGVGLAAPQIGKNLRIISTTQREEKKKENKLIGEIIMINPEIIEKSKEMIVFEEACLSLPNIIGKVKRNKIITVQYLDLKGNLQKKKLKNLNSTIAQHEIDHLDGILFMDKAMKEPKKKEKN